MEHAGEDGLDCIELEVVTDFYDVSPDLTLDGTLGNCVYCNHLHTFLVLAAARETGTSLKHWTPS